MKSTLKKSMAMILVVLMALSCCAVSSFAAVSNVTFSVEKIGEFVADSSSSASHSRDIAIYGNYLYVHTRNEALKVYDITNPAAPELVYTMGSTLYGEGITDSSYTIDIYEDTLFMSFIDSTNTANAIVRSFDLTNPVQPTLKATFESFWKNTNAIEVLSDGTLYCSFGNGWHTYSNAHEATGTVTKTASITSGKYKVYESESGKGAFRFILGSSAAPVGGGNQIDLASEAFATTGDYIYVLRDNALDVVNVSSSAFTTAYDSKTTVDLTSLNFDETAVGEKGVVSNNHLFFFSANGILEFDVTNPANPVNVSNTLAGATAQNAVASGNYFYTVNGGTVNVYKTASNGISMQRQAEAFAPTAAAAYTLVKKATNVASYGDYLFFGTTEGADGLCSYNVKTGVLVTGITPRVDPNGPQSLLLDGTDLYVAILNDGHVRCYDISTPSSPTLKFTVAGSATGSKVHGWFGAIAKAGDTLYMTGNYATNGHKYADVSAEPSDSGYIATTAQSNDGITNVPYMAYGNDENLYSILADNTLRAVNKGGNIDTGAYSVFTNAGYLYVLKNDALKVVKEADIYSDGTTSAELYAANGTTIAVTGADESRVRTVPVVWNNYLLYAADKLIAFDITNPAAPVPVVFDDITFAGTGKNTGMAINDNVLYVTNQSTTVSKVNLAYAIQEVASTEITALPVTFAGTASGVASITLTVGSGVYTVPVVNGAWEKTITEVSDDNGAITVTATAGASEVSANYTLNLPVEEPAELAVSVAYTDAFNATVTIENNTDAKSFMVILVVYNGNEIYDVDYEVISATDTLSCVAPEGDVSGYTAKTFVWSDLMVPFLTVPAAN